MKQIVKTSIATGVSMAAVAGLVFVPTMQASAATDTATPDTTITATIAPVISVTAGASVGFTMTPTSGAVESNASNTVTVDTNNATGYYLQLKDADATLTLTNGGNSIAASSNTYAAPATLANNTWGYAVAGGNFSGSYSVETDVASSSLKYAGITATNQTIKTTGTTATGDTTAVWYAAKVDTSKATGAYTDDVTYTATTN